MLFPKEKDNFYKIIIKNISEIGYVLISIWTCIFQVPATSPLKGSNSDFKNSNRKPHIVITHLIELEFSRI